MLILTCDYFYFSFLRYLVLSRENLTNQQKIKKFQRYVSNNLHKRDKCALCQDIFLNIPQVNTLLYSSIHCSNLVIQTH